MADNKQQEKNQEKQISGLKSAFSNSAEKRLFNRRRKSQTMKMQRMAVQQRNSIFFALLSIVLCFVCLNIGFWARGTSELMDALGIGTKLHLENVNPGMTIVGNTDSSLAARVAEV